jgi:hypothetical protein
MGASTVQRGRRARNRWLVHVGLLATTITSLVVEPMLGLHIAPGIAFALLVCAHLAQRRHSSLRLVRRLARVGAYLEPQGRLALCDALLVVLTLGMLVSGFWDWSLGHPTTIRWHALTGVATVILLVHTLNRTSRLQTSRVE